jgi:ActR/RegA family two-component response regulator
MYEPVAIVVLESAPRWAPELQRQLEDSPFMVRACRTVASFRERLQASLAAGTPCIGLIDLAIGLSSGLTLVAWLNAQDTAGTVIIGDFEAVTLEPALRELGATAVHAESISGYRLASECRRFARVCQIDA